MIYNPLFSRSYEKWSKNKVVLVQPFSKVDFNHDFGAIFVPPSYFTA